MDKIECHSSTTKQDLIDFVERHKGKKINIHYENNIYNSWGDDDVFTYDTSLERHYKEILETIATHYIHGIECIE